MIKATKGNAARARKGRRMKGRIAFNTRVLRVLPNGEHVLFDQVGPAIVTFLRMQQDYGAPWNLSIDGRFTTTMNASDLGQTNPTSFPASDFP